MSDMEQETNGFRPARLSWVLAFGTGAMVVAMLFCSGFGPIYAMWSRLTPRNR